MKSKKTLVFLIVSIFLISLVSASFGYNNPRLPQLIPILIEGQINQNITNINQTNVTNINQFDQSLNTTDNVQFQNLTLSDKITLGDYIIDQNGDNFRIRNATSTFMFFNKSANQMVFTTNTKFEGMQSSSSPIRLLDGLRLLDINENIEFSIYHADLDSGDWVNVSDVFNHSVVFQLENAENPNGMEWIIWDKVNQRPVQVLSFAGEGRGSVISVRSAIIGTANRPIDENYTMCQNLACNASDVSDLEVEGSIWSGRNITANYFIGDGSLLTGINSDRIISPDTLKNLTITNDTLIYNDGTIDRAVFNLVVSKIIPPVRPGFITSVYILSIQTLF